MKILFVTEYDWSKIVVFDLHVFSERLSLLGHEVYIVDRPDNPVSRVQLRTTEIRKEGRVYPEARVVLKRPGLVRLPGVGLLSAAISYCLEVKRVIEEKEIDVVVLYSVLTNGLQTVYLAGRANIPVIFRCTDPLHKLMPNPVLRAVVKGFERSIYSRVDAVLVNAPQYSEYVIGLGAPESRVRYLPFPLDTRLFHPSVDCSGVRQKWGISESDQVILFMGQLYNFSGIGDFVRQFPDVLKEVPQARLLIVGDGPLRSDVERSVARLGLGHRVILTGYQPFRTMPEYINAATICINTFQISGATEDIFSGKIIQYLACAKATIATPLFGMTSLLPPGGDHGVVYADSATSMAKEAIALLKSPARRRELGQAGLAYVQRVHSIDGVVGELEQVLGRAGEKKRGG